MEQEGLKDWSCGELPREITRKVGGLVLKMYPALVDQKDGVAVKLFEDQGMAESEHHKGLTRLFRIKLSSQLKFALGKMKSLSQVKLFTTGIIQARALEDDLQSLLISEVFVQSRDEWPKNEGDFKALIEQRKGDLVPCAEALDKLLPGIFKSAHSVSKNLKGNISFDRAFSLADIKAHLGQLIYPGFLSQAGMERLKHYPRYLRGIELRQEKLPLQINKDRVWTEELTLLHQSWKRRSDIHQKHKLVDPNLMLYRWMLEEYRVSLFAQQLGTRFPVSAKRLRKLWEEVQDI